MKVGEQCVYLAQMKGMKEKAALAELKMWFEKFEIQEWWDKKVEDLSKGMAQKIQFITTVVHKPKLLILDEPFSGFDPVNADIIKQEILELRAIGGSVTWQAREPLETEPTRPGRHNVLVIHRHVPPTRADQRRLASSGTDPRPRLGSWSTGPNASGFSPHCRAAIQPHGADHRRAPRVGRGRPRC
jgi:hypothetical protein